MRRALLASSVFLVAAGPPLHAQGPPCPEFLVNVQTLGRQNRPSVTSVPDGGFVVVWTTQSDGSGEGIFGRRYDAAGIAQGGDFRVNTTTADSQFGPQVAADGQGGFVVAWTSTGQDGDTNGVYAQRFDSTGERQGPEFRVNSYTTGFQDGPRIAVGPAGDFVVVWDSYEQDGSGNGVFGQRYDASGQAQGPEFAVNTYTTEWQSSPAVSVRPDGAFVVVWDSLEQDGSGDGIFGQRFDADGERQGSEFRINTSTTLSQADSGVAHRSDGGFVAVWISNHQSVNWEIYGRSYDASGTPAGAEFRINTHSGELQNQPFITRDPNGGFIVAWNSRGQDGSDDGIAARRLGPSGAPVGPEFLVNTFTTGDQKDPQVAATPAGGFVVAWQSDGQDGSSSGIFASLDCTRLYTVAPCRVADTRDPTGPSGGPPLQANSARSFSVTGLCGIPADARAVVLNATAVNPSEAGNLRLYPAGQAAPLASALNFTAGLTRANNAVVPLGTDGQVSVQCDMAPGSSGSTNLVLDVFGYFKR